tara:strand:- start:17 stop:274 length:258 start_codon:yes stop_codon:yes gene_type:complete
MIDKQKILEILNKESVSENSSNNNRVIIEQDFEIIADEIVKLFAIPVVVVPKGTLCCPECKSTDLKVAIHTDYNECNKCYHYWET